MHLCAHLYTPAVTMCPDGSANFTFNRAVNYDTHLNAHKPHTHIHAFMRILIETDCRAHQTVIQLCNDATSSTFKL